MNGHPLINRRIQHFQNKKTELLKMKKNERRDELKIVDETISRLKRWNRELEEKEREKSKKIIVDSPITSFDELIETGKRIFCDDQKQESTQTRPEGSGTPNCPGTL